MAEPGGVRAADDDRDMAAGVLADAGPFSLVPSACRGPEVPGG
jgi:hypothetical protein